MLTKPSSSRKWRTSQTNSMEALQVAFFSSGGRAVLRGVRREDCAQLPADPGESAPGWSRFGYGDA